MITTNMYYIDQVNHKTKKKHKRIKSTCENNEESKNDSHNDSLLSPSFHM